LIPRPRWAAGALLAALLGCAAAPPAAGAPPAPASAGEAAEAEISAALARALGGGPAADSLFSPDATVIADGVRVVDGPRFAALGPGGAAAIASSQVDVRNGIAWALLDYRWVAPEANLAREAWATVILAPRPAGGWWIVHAQSSSVR
jgi:hypothetical protein